MKTIDAIASLVIGEVAALLMLAVSRNLALPVTFIPYFRWLLIVFPLMTLAAMALGGFIGRRFLFVYQLTKFVLVGGSNFLIDLGVLNFFIAITGISQGFWAIIFKSLSFLVAVTWSFSWNKFWTFRSLETSSAGRQFIEFFLVTGVGFLINIGGFSAINDWIGPHGGIPAKTWASVAATGAAGIGLVWNFLGYKFLVFKKR